MNILANSANLNLKMRGTKFDISIMNFCTRAIISNVLIICTLSAKLILQFFEELILPRLTQYSLEVKRCDIETYQVYNEFDLIVPVYLAQLHIRDMNKLSLFRIACYGHANISQWAITRCLFIKFPRNSRNMNLLCFKSIIYFKIH